MTSLCSHSQFPAISVKNSPGPFVDAPNQRAVPLPAARGYIDGKAWPQPPPPLRDMDPLVFTTYDVDECSWNSFAPFEVNATKGQQYYDEFAFENHAQSHNPVVVFEDEDDLSEGFEDCRLSTSTVANSPISEFSANYHHHHHHHRQQQLDKEGSMTLDLVAPAAATTTATTAILGSEEYPSPIFAPAPGDDGGCAHLNEYYYPLQLDHLSTNAITLPPVLPDQHYPPDSWSPFLAQDTAETAYSTGDINEAITSKESFLPAATTESSASMVTPPSHVHLHAPRPMRIENTAAHLAALVEREESKLEAQERDEPPVDSVIESRTTNADQLSPLTAPALVLPYAQPTHTRQVQPSHVVPPSFVSQSLVGQSQSLSAVMTPELPRRRIQPILELDTSGRTMQLRQSMRARRHARNLSVPMSADALQYRPVGWKGRQDVVGSHPHLLVQEQQAYGAWTGSNSRSMDWSTLGGHIPFLQPPALAYLQPETYAPAALY